ncbi:hypothetical protein [Pedobacter insulae]|uniref:Uncharacterized protein n=1 Tax=Pedobacter insulae TaxID=414048 RepID=A0A1I2Y1C5_9SPHI|nr:hypothetical protein [Pedobacter insulae]SFH19550.1 hypothetical protein SAMN04489864_106171 [Pedobacter insulae]
MAQNRVNPFGNIIETSARGTWLGNRGQLHGNGKTILRPFKHQAWIICLLQFKDRQRQIMAPNLWTELFFLDEATALAAGHRPCFECRRADANRFKQAWLSGNPHYGYDRKTTIGKIDAILQRERIDVHQQKVTHTALISTLPNGTFVAIAQKAYLLVDEQIFQWTPSGYLNGKETLNITSVAVLTPQSVVNALRAGYLPQMSHKQSDI